MSIVCASGVESLSVAFEPRPGADNGLTPPADFSNLPVVHQILKRFYEPLSELGRRAGVSQPQLSRFLNRERTLTLTAAARLCRALGLKLVKAGEQDGEAARQPGQGRRARAQ